MLDVREYIDAAGRSPFTKWLRALNVHAAAKVATALERVAGGNLSNVIGNGVLESKIDFGPGYRIYFGRDGGRLIILLAWHEEAPARRHPPGKGELGRLPKPEDLGKHHGTDQRFSRNDSRTRPTGTPIPQGVAS